MTTLLLIGKVNPRVRERLTGRFDIMELPSAKAEDITTKISERGDKNYSTQVYAEMDLGAVRMEDEKVLQLQCKEGA